MKNPDISRMKQIADEIRPFWPEKAAEIDAAIIAAQSGHRDGLKINVVIKYRIEKYDGEYRPGAAPIETIEGEG